MLYPSSPIAFALFVILVALALAFSFWLSRRAKSAQNPAGKTPALVLGFALTGNSFSAAAILGICGLIAFYGYDGFLYSIGLFAGWTAAVFLIAWPLRRFGTSAPADAAGSPSEFRSVRLAVAASSLVISLAFLFPEFIAAGTLGKSLFGLPRFAIGRFADGRFIASVVLVGGILTLLAWAVSRGSALWLQCFKGSLLILFSVVITALLFARGFSPKPAAAFPRILSNTQFAAQIAPVGKPIAPAGPWLTLPFYRLTMPDGSISTWLVQGQSRNPPQLFWPSTFIECETASTSPGGKALVNGRPQSPSNDILPVNFIRHLPGSATPAQSLGPRSFFSTLQESDIAITGIQTLAETINGQPYQTTIYFPEERGGNAVLTPGMDPALFPGIKFKEPASRLNFLSLMLALLLGTAALPANLTSAVIFRAPGRPRSAARICACVLAVFFILTLFLGLGAMTSAKLDPSDSNIPLLLLSRSFGDWALALISAVIFLALLGSVPGWLTALTTRDIFKPDPARHAKPLLAKISAPAIGIIAIALSIPFRQMNIAFLLGWALAIAASANLPFLSMPLIWKRTTPQGIAASIFVGLFSSLAWILLSADAFTHLYGLPASQSPIPFNQPALVTLPLSLLTLIIVSLLTPGSRNRKAPAPAAS